MSDDPAILMCTPVEKMPVPVAPTRRERCASCNAEVWVSEGWSRRRVDRGAMILCEECGILAFKVGDDHLHLPAEQIKELSGLLKGQAAAN
jgi:hypothetical protein